MNGDKEFMGYQVERPHGFAGLPLGTAIAADEFLHPAAASGHYASTETSYFGFNIPERALNCEIYVWFHPVLKVISAGVFIWTGLKKELLECEYVHYHHFLPWPENGIADYRIDAIDMHIRVIEPLKSVEISFDDKARGVSLNYRLDAIMPPGVRPGGYHFTQAMRTKGQLTLFGERMKIDGFFTRDRSWSQERREDARDHPSLSWMVGAFNENFAFHAMAYDDPAMNPEWVQHYPAIKTGGNLYWGYLWKDGALTSVVAARNKITTRDPDGLSPRVVEVEIEDEKGRIVPIRGYVQARMPWHTWQNMNVICCQMRWETAGLVCYGDMQEGQFNEYTKKFAR